MSEEEEDGMEGWEDLAMIALEDECVMGKLESRRARCRDWRVTGERVTGERVTAQTSKERK